MLSKTLMAAMAASFVGISFVASASTVDKEMAVYAVREQSAPANVRSEIAAQRQLIASMKLGYTVGATSKAGEDVSKLLGASEPAADKAGHAAVTAAQISNLESQSRNELLNIYNILRVVPPNTSTASARFDYRELFDVTAVKDQGQVGTCWDFASCGALESSELFRNQNYAWAAEQQVLTCSGGGTINGGWHIPVFQWFISHGVTYGGGYNCPYNPLHPNQAADSALPSWYHGALWGYVAPNGATATTAQIKTALVAHGPIVSAVDATNWPGSYTSGVLPGIVNDSRGIDHDIMIIGWDDDVVGANGVHYGCWIIKNSWGAWWGSTCGYGKEGGYCYLPFTTSDIGYGAAWIDAKLGG